MDNIKNLFKRVYTKELENQSEKNVYDLFKWKTVDVFMKDYKTGKVLIDMKDLEFPENYSQNACDIIASKYFRKAGLKEKPHYENSLKMVADRMVNFWGKSLKDEGLIETEKEASIFYDEMVYAFLNQMYAPNSPQWFNTGLFQSYGIRGKSQGNFYYDENENKVVQSKDNYSRTQASACFIISIEDKLLGKHSISEQYVTETKLFKGGSGTGTNFSTIRAKNERLSGGGFSSGLMSFLKGLDKNAGAIKSGGTTRRAAKMLCLDVDHPEIMDYITWKSKEENKVRALGKMGYDMGFEGEAYETVSGQNGNNSVKFSHEFMEKVENLKNDPNAEIELTGRTDDSVSRKIKVREVWDTFNKSAWECADPAPLFDDRLNQWHTCPYGEDGNFNAKYNRINSTNPCGEYAFLNDTSCNLASINVYKFYDNDTNTFDVDGYIHVIGLVQLILEASIHWGQFPTEDVARRTYMFRTTGLGISNLASLLMVKGYPYDSDKGRTLAASLAGILTSYSYYVSALMAEKVGTFPKYKLNSESMKKVIRNHARAAGVLQTDYEGLDYTPLQINHNLLRSENLDHISDALNEGFNKAIEYGNKFGYRNAQVTVIAPTGTISFAMDCGATSIEPFFSHIIYKKLSGGGFMTIINPVLKASLKNLGYSKNQIQDIMDYMLRKETIGEGDSSYEKILDGKIEGAPHLKEEHLPIFDCANKCGSGKRYISPMGHVLMVASIVPLISGSISKTVNLPKNASVDDFKNVILKSWQLGIKGITLYRDSSKASQPLNTSLEEDTDTELEDMTYDALIEKIKYMQSHSQKLSRSKPNGIRRGTTHPAQIGSVKIYTTVNRDEQGNINEIYITTDREGTIISGLLNSLSKSISVMLQYHVPPEDISGMLRGQNYEPYGFVQKHPYIKHVSSISDLISKIIDIEVGDFSSCQVKPEDYNNTPMKEISAANLDNSDLQRVYDITCPNCSSTRMVRNGTCYVCLDCGTTTGCS